MRRAASAPHRRPLLLQRLHCNLLEAGAAARARAHGQPEAYRMHSGGWRRPHPAGLINLDQCHRIQSGRRAARFGGRANVPLKHTLCVDTLLQ